MKLRVRSILFAALALISWLATTNFALAQTTVAQEIYLRNCSSCHLPLPAQVLPSEKWQQILNNPDKHYGVSLPTSIKVQARLIWTYLGRESRPLNPGERLPNTVASARYFQALHPLVELPDPVNHQSCATCHPKAKVLDYETIASEPAN